MNCECREDSLSIMALRCVDGWGGSGGGGGGGVCLSDLGGKNSSRCRGFESRPSRVANICASKAHCGGSVGGVGGGGKRKERRKERRKRGGRGLRWSLPTQAGLAQLGEGIRHRELCRHVGRKTHSDNVGNMQHQILPLGRWRLVGKRGRGTAGGRAAGRGWDFPRALTE